MSNFFRWLVLDGQFRVQVFRAVSSVIALIAMLGTIYELRWGTDHAALWWQARCMAIDRYDRVEDNLAAIAATLSAMRAIERHGGAEILDRAFTGFIALPAPEQPWQVLGLNTSTPTREAIELAYRLLAQKHHPDRGGDSQQMARINTARDELLGAIA